MHADPRCLRPQPSDALFPFLLFFRPPPPPPSALRATSPAVVPLLRCVLCCLAFCTAAVTTPSPPRGVYSSVRDECACGSVQGCGVPSPHELPPPLLCALFFLHDNFSGECVGSIFYILSSRNGVESPNSLFLLLLSVPPTSPLWRAAQCSACCPMLPTSVGHLSPLLNV